MQLQANLSKLHTFLGAFVKNLSDNEYSVDGRLLETVLLNLSDTLDHFLNSEMVQGDTVETSPPETVTRAPVPG